MQTKKRTPLPGLYPRGKTNNRNTSKKTKGCCVLYFHSVILHVLISLHFFHLHSFLLNLPLFTLYKFIYLFIYFCFPSCCFSFFALWVLIYWNSIMMCYLGGHNVEVECVAKQNYIDNFDNIIDSTVINHDSSCDMGITFFTIVLRLTA